MTIRPRRPTRGGDFLARVRSAVCTSVLHGAVPKSGERGADAIGVAQLRSPHSVFLRTDTPYGIAACACEENFLSLHLGPCSVSENGLDF